MSTLRDIYDMACPKCDNDDELRVLVEAVATLTPDGTTADGSHHEWNLDHYCSCPVCRFDGIVADFMIDEDGGAS